MDSASSAEWQKQVRNDINKCYVILDPVLDLIQYRFRIHLITITYFELDSASSAEWQSGQVRNDKNETYVILDSIQDPLSN